MLPTAAQRQIARNLVQQLATYVTGAPVRFGDRAEIEQAEKGESRNGGHSYLTTFSYGKTFFYSSLQIPVVGQFGGELKVTRTFILWIPSPLIIPSP